MNNSWIKLYRSIKDDALLMKGDTLKVWVWILLSVDLDTGEMTTGRHIASSTLGISPTSFYTIINRLKTQQRIDINTTATHTTISVMNWAKYQGGNRDTTEIQQRYDTKQEKNKNNNNTYIPKPLFKTPDYLLNIPPEDLPSLVKGLNVDQRSVLRKAETLYNWYLSNTRKNRRDNYKSVLRNALMRDFPILEEGGKNAKDYRGF